MPDRRVGIDSLGIGPAVTVGRVALLPIERTVLHAALNGGHTGLAGGKYLHALIVRDASGVRAVVALGQPVSMADLHQQLPELDARLAGL